MSPASDPSHPFRLERHAGGFTLTVPALGLAGHWRDALLSLALVVALLVAFTLGGIRLTQAAGWLDWGVWLGVLLVCALLLRPIGLFVNLRLLEPQFGRGTIKVEVGRLFIRWGVVFTSERVWEAQAIRALDEEEALCVLSEAGLETFFVGRDPGELGWLAEEVRRDLDVPRDPPGLGGEILVSYRMPGWDRPRRGFARIEPGQFLLRLRFSLHTGLVLRSAKAERDGAGGPVIEPEDVRWGIGEGGQAVLRIWMHEEAGKSVALELTTERVVELRRALQGFW